MLTANRYRTVGVVDFPADLEQIPIMLNHISTRHSRACPGHLDYLAPRLMIEVAGTGPAMTHIYVLIQNDRNTLPRIHL